MTNFFRSLFRKNTSSTSNQSMIDLIFENNDHNESFRSHQPQLDRSFSLPDEDLHHPTERMESLGDLPGSRTNIVSVFNNPKRMSLMEELYEILGEQVNDQLGRLFKPSKKAPPTKLLKVQQKDFDAYILKIRKAYDVYKKRNEARLRKMKDKGQINIVGTLMKCYEVVPGQYFEGDFVFDFQFFTRDKDRIIKIQDDLEEYLDHVETNLNYQITNRFQEFLDVILKLNQMDAQIQNCLYSIKFFRNFNKELKTKCADKVVNVLKLKRRKMNIEKTLAILEIINVVQNTLPTLVSLIEKNNYKYAVELVRSSEDTYKTKLKPVKALKNFNTNFTEAKSTLEKMLTSEFEEKAIGYITPAFGYNKNAGNPNITDVSISMMEESFMNISTADLGHDDKSMVFTSLYWSVNEIQKNENLENNIAKIVMEYIKIKDFPLTVFKAKLLEKLRSFHKQFLVDMEEHIESLKKADDKTIEISYFDLHVKFILFYFELFKRFFTRNCDIIFKTMKYILDYYENNFADKQDDAEYSHKPLLDTRALKNLNETVNEFYSTLAMIFKFFNDKMTEVINYTKVDSVTIGQFAKLIAVFDEIGNFFEKKLQYESRLTSWITTNRDSMKKPLMRLVSSCSEKINISPLTSLRTEHEKNFIALLHKQKLELLKKSLEDEEWAPADIPYTHVQFFSHWFEEKEQSEGLTDRLETAEDILKSSRPDLGDIITQLATEEDGGESTREKKISEMSPIKKSDIISILKSELYIHKKRYKLTKSFLLLLSIFYDYYQIATRFKTITMDAISKMFEMIKTYNSLTTQLILGAGATAYGKIKKITAKILALSMISLHLLIDLMDPIQGKIEKKLKINKEWVQFELSKIKQDMTYHADEIASKIRNILKAKLVEQCAEIKKINWANAQEKINIPTKQSANILNSIKQMYRLIEDLLFHEHMVLIYGSVLNDIKETFVPIFETINIESQIAAKRIKEELNYFKDDLATLPIYQHPELKFADFEGRILSIIHNRCNHLIEVTSIN